jgi:hypothetical protein
MKIPPSPLLPGFLILTASLLTPVSRAGQVEVGPVAWGRDYQAGLEASRTSGKPVLLFFQEVPGCAGCQKFGREVMSHPQIVEAIETEFVPVLVYNNRPGEDAALLQRFGEAAWNYQVLRFLDASGKDLIPRRDGVWTLDAIAARLTQALETAHREVPPYLRVLAGADAAGEVGEVGTAAFAMDCFWTGEVRFGGIPGVLSTEAGVLEGREVTLITFDRAALPFEQLVRQAVSFDCANKVYTTNPADAATVAETRLTVAPLTEAHRPPTRSDQKRQIADTPFASLSLSPTQATKVNPFARTDPTQALTWLSPGQRAEPKIP